MKKTFFWFGLIFTGFNLLPLPDDGSFPSSPNRETTTMVVDNKKFQAQELCSEFRCGGQKDSLPFISQKSQKKFDSGLHHKLEQSFPDWEGRMNFQQKQKKFYESAIKKKVEFKRLRMIDRHNIYTKEELDALNYFDGTGFYRKHQDPKTKPNIFDNRQTFLLKMHDDQMRDEFLASFNRKN